MRAQINRNAARLGLKRVLTLAMTELDKRIVAGELGGDDGTPDVAAALADLPREARLSPVVWWVSRMSPRGPRCRPSQCRQVLPFIPKRGARTQELVRIFETLLKTLKGGRLLVV